MKTLELENYGVTEMSNNEMKEVDGGFWQIVVGALLGYALSADFGDIADAYNEGYSAGRN